ncbi:MAG TPA: hypothetical protein VHY08_08905 [Bacillota bacterium]|nr:hypothetical protein [Bacillota bacterium]
MKKLPLLILGITLLIIIFASSVGGKDYFLYDFEKDKILFMGSEDTVFTEKINMEKNPHLVMQTYDPQKFLCVSKPDDQNNKAAQLYLFDISSGRTEDLIELGYARLCWDYTKDRKDFFIAYKPTPDSESFDILHYNIPEKKTEVMTKVANQVLNVYISEDDKNIFLVKGKEEKESAQMITLSYAPWKVESKLTVGDDPNYLYVLGGGKVAILNRNSKGGNKSSLQYIDTKTNELTDYRLYQSKVYYQWYEDEKVLVVATRDLIYQGSFSGSGEFFRVNAQGVKKAKAGVWFDFEYLPKQDKLTILGEFKLRIIDYSDDSDNFYSTKTNNYYLDDNDHMIYIYQVQSVTDVNLLTIACFKKQSIKFFSLDQKKLLKEVKTGKWKLFKSGGDSKPTINVNPNKDRYYVMSCATDDITVFDQDFKQINYISIPESALNMYQIKKPTLQSIVVTEKNIYQLDYDKCVLVPIFEFKEKAKETAWVEDEKRVIIYTDREMVVIELATMKATNSFQFYGDPNEKYTKLKKGEQRYYFIRTL